MKTIYQILFICLMTAPLHAQLYFPPTNSSTWATTDPSTLGWCQPKIDSLYHFLEANSTKAFILLKDGKIVLEKYFNGHSATNNWYWASAGKTLTSTLVGLAQQDNKLNISDLTSKYLGTGWTSCTPTQENKITISDVNDSGLLLNTNSGIFFEFIPTEEYFNDHPRRLSIEEVELGKNYAVIINSNAGLWGYSIGDTVKSVSKNPYRIVVSGRIKHFISAFGENVIGEEVEKAMKLTMQKFPEVELVEFTVAPNVAPTEGMPHHEWLIDFANLQKT